MGDLEYRDDLLVGVLDLLREGERLLDLLGGVLSLGGVLERQERRGDLDLPCLGLESLFLGVLDLGIEITYCDGYLAGLWRARGCSMRQLSLI